MKKVIEVYDASLSYRTHRLTVAQVFAMCIWSSINSVLVAVLAGWSLGMEVPLAYYFLIMPIVGFISVLPSTPNGIGIAEGGLVLLLTQGGASVSEALALALVMRALSILVTLPGGLLLATGGLPSKVAPTAGPRVS